jgi:hypothetical protein
VSQVSASAKRQLVNTTPFAEGAGPLQVGTWCAAAGSLLVSRDALATAVAAHRTHSCAGERILSIIPAGAAARSKAAPHCWTSVPPSLGGYRSGPPTPEIVPVISPVSVVMPGAMPEPSKNTGTAVSVYVRMPFAV